jgi:hypothetical protein
MSDYDARWSATVVEFCGYHEFIRFALDFLHNRSFLDRNQFDSNFEKTGFVGLLISSFLAKFISFTAGKLPVIGIKFSVPL